MNFTTKVKNSPKSSDARNSHLLKTSDATAFLYRQKFLKFKNFEISHSPTKHTTYILHRVLPLDNTV